MISMVRLTKDQKCFRFVVDVNKDVAFERIYIKD